MIHAGNTFYLKYLFIYFITLVYVDREAIHKIENQKTS